MLQFYKHWQERVLSFKAFKHSLHIYEISRQNILVLFFSDIKIRKVISSEAFSLLETRWPCSLGQERRAVLTIQEMEQRCHQQIDVAGASTAFLDLSCLFASSTRISPTALSHSLCVHISSILQAVEKQPWSPTVRSDAGWLFEQEQKFKRTVFELLL